MLKDVIFQIVLSVGLVQLLGLGIALIYPKSRIWPPPGRKSWQFWFIWGLGPFSLLGVPVVAIFDWNSFIFTHWIRFVIGGVLLSFGFLFGLWSVRTLKVNQSLGLKGNFIRSGPYQYTRNPQYVGDIFMYIGFIIISNSIMALVTGIVVILWFVIAPFCEEPWLKEQFSDEYEEYSRLTPRFLGTRSFKSNNEEVTT